ncbi:hypothetical protein [Bremerella volcania]|uniref:hypothetical protein n=1 Tax=Bremerella volcania TaxID=2527984 RepID=UPI0011A67E84|nr:hypothetical protein [Bremerella volcania]
MPLLSQVKLIAWPIQAGFLRFAMRWPSLIGGIEMIVRTVPWDMRFKVGAFTASIPSHQPEITLQARVTIWQTEKLSKDYFPIFSRAKRTDFVFSSPKRPCPLTPKSFLVLFVSSQLGNMARRDKSKTLLMV